MVQPLKFAPRGLSLANGAICGSQRVGVTWG